MGEAANQVTPATRDRHRSIPWPAIVGMRHRLIHAYFDINRDVLWQTVQQDLPSLTAALNEALEKNNA